MEAVERLLARGGINAVTMRGVATEANVSLRLVQYYGHTKDELLSATLDRHADRSIERWRARTAQHGGSPSPIDAIKAFLDEALPTDRASQDFHRLGVSMEEIAISNPDVAGLAYQKHLSGLADDLASLIQSDDLNAAAARSLALEVLGLAHGLGTLLMTRQISEPEAHDLINNYVERIRPHLPARTNHYDS